MSNKEQAYQILYKELEKGLLFDYNHGEVNIGYMDMMEFITDKMIEFSRMQCELQKIQCLNEAQVLITEYSDDCEIYSDSILNCKNVCDE